MTNYRRAVTSLRVELLFPATLLAIDYLFYRLLYWSHSFVASDFLLTTGVSIVLYLPYLWFRTNVPKYRGLHLLIAWSALVCIVPFILIEWAFRASLREIYFVAWGALATGMLASNVVAIRRLKSPAPAVVLRSTMPVSFERETSSNELGRLIKNASIRGDNLYQNEIRSRVEPAAQGRFVVIDLKTGDYEIDARDALATRRLLERRPGALTYAVRVGRPTPYRIGGNFRNQA